MKLSRKDLDNSDSLQGKEKAKRKRPHEFDSRSGGIEKKKVNKRFFDD